MPVICRTCSLYVVDAPASGEHVCQCMSPDCALDAARAEGGAGEGLAARQLTAPGSTAPPEAISPPPPPGGVEELVEKLLAEHVRKINRVVAAGMHEGDAIRHAAEAITAPLARLLEERTRELDEALDAEQEAQASADTWLAEHKLSAARAETAERLLGEVVGALRRIQTGYRVNHTSKWVKQTVDEALSKVSEGGFSPSQGSVEGPGCVPAANHDAVLDNVRPEIREEVAYALRLASEGAVSQEGRQ